MWLEPSFVIRLDRSYELRVLACEPLPSCHLLTTPPPPPPLPLFSCSILIMLQASNTKSFMNCEAEDIKYNWRADMCYLFYERAGCSWFLLFILGCTGCGHLVLVQLVHIIYLVIVFCFFFLEKKNYPFF